MNIYKETAHQYLSKYTYAITAGVNGINCAIQTLSSIKSLLIYCTTADPDVRYITKLHGAHQGILALTSGGKMIGNVMSFILDEGLPSTVATIGGFGVKQAVNSYFNPRIKEYGNQHAENPIVTRIQMRSQAGRPADILDHVVIAIPSLQPSNIQLVSPQTDVQLVSLQTDVQLVSPQIDIQLMSPPPTTASPQSEGQSSGIQSPVVAEGPLLDEEREDSPLPHLEHAHGVADPVLAEEEQPLAAVQVDSPEQRQYDPAEGLG